MVEVIQKEQLAITNRKLLQLQHFLTTARLITEFDPHLPGAGWFVNLGYMTQEQRELDPQLNALDCLSKTAAKNETEQRGFLSKFLFKGDEVFVPVEKLSYGERARLSLACLVASGCNFLILDEPINHLDIPSRTNFEQALSQFEGTVLAVVHDRFFINAFATAIWEVQSKSIIRNAV